MEMVLDRKAAEMRDQLAMELTRFRGDSVMADDQAFLVLIEEGGGATSTAPAGERGAQPRRTASPFFFNS